MSVDIYQFDASEVDALVLSWVNNLSASAMDKFFWDYTTVTDYSAVGYGLGITTARRIVSRRKSLPDGFQNMQSLLDVKGIGEDKLGDMRIQAKEALALGLYYKIPFNPMVFWETLSIAGPGGTLRDFTSELVEYATTAPHLCQADEIELKIPFVAIITKGKQRLKELTNPEPFIRIRTQPWAFYAHPNSLWWRLLIKLDRKILSVRIERYD